MSQQVLRPPYRKLTLEKLYHKFRFVCVCYCNMQMRQYLAKFAFVWFDGWGGFKKKIKTQKSCVFINMY